MNTKFKRFIVCGILLLCTLYLNPKPTDAKSSKSFYRNIVRRPLAVAMFYYQDRCQSNDKSYACKFVWLDRIFSAASDQGDFRQAGVQFIKANTKNCSIKELAERFSIDQAPAFVLFENGVPLKNEQGNPIVLIGWPTYDKLEQFIREHLEKDIEKNIKRKAEEIRELRAITRLNYAAYQPYLWGGAYPCGPWGGWGWGCGAPWRPYWGCGVGFGCGRGCW